MNFRNYSELFSMRKIGCSCFLFVVAMFVGCSGNSKGVQMPENPVKMPEDILDREQGNTQGVEKTVPKKNK